VRNPKTRFSADYGFPLAFRPFFFRSRPLFPLKKLLKIGTHLTADIRYENHVQFMWEIRGKSENFAGSYLLKTLWNTCGKVADKHFNKWWKPAAAAAGRSRITFCKHGYLRIM
jgi:hypothetical protein